MQHRCRGSVRRGKTSLMDLPRSVASLAFLLFFLLLVATAVYGYVSGKRQEAERQRRDEKRNEGAAAWSEESRKHLAEF